MFDADIEEEAFSRRNRRRRNIQPTLNYNGPFIPPNQRGSNRIDRILVRPREVFQQENEDQSEERLSNRRRINVNDLEKFWFDWLNPCL